MEIEFRAWDKEIKHMIQDSPISMATIMKHYIGNAISFNGVRLSDRYELMQYIGLRDKNRKKIFKGDIVAACGLVAEIIYEHASFCFKWIDGRTDNVRRLGNEPIWSNVGMIFEVVGNIYENPELREVG